jgi:MinD-like ATPase involved in chromosome partitioning or flagellar assembly
MLLILKLMTDLQNDFESLKDKNLIMDYKLILKLNLKIHALIFENELSSNVDYSCYNKLDQLSLELIDGNTVKDDPHLKQLIDSLANDPSLDSRVDLGIRRRFSHLLNYNRSKGLDFDNKPFPIITFYSYKGGVGRSTTLASYAAHLAYNESKKVLILDCDFEAPGFSNFFDITYEKAVKKGGVIEYLINRSYSDEPIELNDYIIEVDKEYTNQGSIYVMPAGNLSDSCIDDDEKYGIHLDHFLEGLARVDLSGSEIIIKQFFQLFNDIENSQFKPDILLIDSRTGFNDIFGLTAFNFSDIVLGFFGNSNQTKPGLQYFIDAATRIKQKYNVILINSIISDYSLFDNFKEDVENFINMRFQGLDDLPNFRYFAINRHPILERLGIRNENRKNFIRLIANQNFSDYSELFNSTSSLLQDLNNKTPIVEGHFELSPTNVEIPEIHEAGDDSIENNSVNDVPSITDVPQLSLDRRIYSMLNLKRSLLNQLHDDFLEPYAENVVFDEYFLERRFYFRPKMYNVFNREKFLIIGSKGTGKTSLYKALQSDSFINQLKIRAGKEDVNYISTPIISMQNDTQLDRLLKITGNFEVSEIVDYERFFKRFWIIYVWNVILMDIKNKKFLLEYSKDLSDIFNVKNDEITVQRFKNFIKDDEKILSIESDLVYINKLLSDQNQYLIILFDQLDFIAKPAVWDKCISPLINVWRANSYSHIYPKIFLRTDLFNKISNVTNKQELRNQNIEIEWSQEEIFSFFFKWVFSSTSGEFGNLIKLYDEFPEEIIKEIKQKTIYQQVPPERKLLEPYVNTFFGKYADRKGSDTRFGLSYDWFYSNLKNSDNTISLRPFLDLIKAAINQYLKLNLRTDLSVHPILPAFYYAHPEARKEAVRRHFNDLADEEGNSDLRIIFNHISKLAPNHALKKTYFKKREFDSLIESIINSNKDSLQNTEPDKLKDLLIMNGLVSEIAVSGAYLNYRFAFLYKYFLGLK